MKTVTDYLIAVGEKLSTGGGWTTEVSARDMNGRPCEPTSPNAVQFCMLGAIDAVTYPVWDTTNMDAQCKQFIKKAICQKTDNFISTIPDFNDHANFEEVKAVVDLAVELSRLPVAS